MCRTCKQANDRIYSRKYREDNPAWKKASNRRNIKGMAEAVARWHKKNPEKLRAHKLVRAAVVKGQLIRKPCYICKSDKVQGHHPDYSKPLEVIWLCSKHHKGLHFGLVSI
jgi:hypothetical protein